MLGNLQHIQVAVRCRPMNDREKKQNSISVIECNEKKREITAADRSSGVANTKTFTFDRVFGPLSKQIEVYNQVVKPVVMEVIEGYNCTIFAYGQTGTGKTFTMEGERSSNSADLSWEEDPFVGIIPRSVSQLFSVLCSLNCCEYSVKISFIELYNEELSDLLSESNENEKLRIFDDPARKGSVIIPGLEEIVVQNKSEVYKILQKGAEKRQKASTLMNSQSSRSHSIFTITVFIKEKSIDGEETIKVGKLNLVDLAGSENIERSGATGKRAAEAGKINKSLTTLGRVITALVEHRDHIPYRESNLTRLLQDSLGGRTKTSIIATISPAQCNFEETLSTLDYAYKAKSIKNKPEVNQKLVKKALIKEYTEEIERLKRELCATREKNGIYLPSELYQNMEAKLENQKEEIRELLQKINALNDEIDKLQELFKETKDNLQEKTVQLVATQTQLKQVEIKLESAEQERDENKYLLQEQVITENNLHTQADQLLKTAILSTSDCTQLHDKLDRKYSIEKHNQLTTNLFHEHMNKRNEIFIMNKNETFDLNCERLKRLETVLDGFGKRLNENKDENVCSLSMFNDKQYNWHEIQMKLLDDYCLNNCLEFKEASMKLNTASLNSYFDYLIKFKESSSENFSQNFNLNKNLNENLSSIENFLKNNQIKLNDEVQFYENNLSKRIQARANVEYDEINEIKTQICFMQNKLVSLCDYKSKFHDNVMASINNLTQTLNEQFKYIDNELLDTNSKLNSQVDRLNLFLNKIKTNENEIITESKHDLDKNILDLNNLMFEEAYGKINQVCLTAKSLEENSVKNHEYCEESVNHLKAVAQDDSAKLNALVTNQINELENKIQQLSENIRSNKKESSNFMNNYIEQCVQNETNNLTNIIDESVKLTLNTQESINAFNQEINEFINENARVLEKYSKEELKTDVSSGATPQRRVFVYPTNLCRTQSHTILLEQYREELKNIKNKNKQLINDPKLANASRSSSLDSVSSTNSLKRTTSSSQQDLKNEVVIENNKENSRQDSITSESKSKTITTTRSAVNKKTLGVRNN